MQTSEYHKDVCMSVCMCVCVMYICAQLWMKNHHFTEHVQNWHLPVGSRGDQHSCAADHSISLSHSRAATNIIHGSFVFKINKGVKSTKIDKNLKWKNIRMCLQNWQNLKLKNEWTCNELIPMSRPHTVPHPFLLRIHGGSLLHWATTQSSRPWREYRTTPRTYEGPPCSLKNDTQTV